MLETLKNKILNELKKRPSQSQGLDFICQLLQTEIPHYDWVGFYFHIPGKQMLELKAFAGPPTEHTHIPFGKGICGQVALSSENFVVEDVQKQNNYISCNINVKSEIVIPLFLNKVNVGQIDIDSNKINAFGERDVNFLTQINAWVSKYLM